MSVASYLVGVISGFLKSEWGSTALSDLVSMGLDYHAVSGSQLSSRAIGPHKPMGCGLQEGERHLALSGYAPCATPGPMEGTGCWPLGENGGKRI